MEGRSKIGRRFLDVGGVNSGDVCGIWILVAACGQGKRCKWLLV